MMFGIPAAALAMYHTAKTTQKKQVYGWFLASSVAAFFVGVTEPIEFCIYVCCANLICCSCVINRIIFIYRSYIPLDS